MIPAPVRSLHAASGDRGDPTTRPYGIPAPREGGSPGSLHPSPRDPCTRRGGTGEILAPVRGIPLPPADGIGPRSPCRGRAGTYHPRRGGEGSGGGPAEARVTGPAGPAGPSGAENPSSPAPPPPRRDGDETGDTVTGRACACPCPAALPMASPAAPRGDAGPLAWRRAAPPRAPPSRATHWRRSRAGRLAIGRRCRRSGRGGVAAAPPRSYPLPPPPPPSSRRGPAHSFPHPRVPARRGGGDAPGGRGSPRRAAPPPRCPRSRPVTSGLGRAGGPMGRG